LRLTIPLTGATILVYCKLSWACSTEVWFNSALAWAEPKLRLAHRDLLRPATGRPQAGLRLREGRQRLRRVTLGHGTPCWACATVARATSTSAAAAWASDSVVSYCCRENLFPIDQLLHPGQVLLGQGGARLGLALACLRRGELGVGGVHFLARRGQAGLGRLHVGLGGAEPAGGDGGHDRHAGFGRPRGGARRFRVGPRVLERHLVVAWVDFDSTVPASTYWLSSTCTASTVPPTLALIGLMCPSIWASSVLSRIE